jgi:hypothetical protein
VNCEPFRFGRMQASAQITDQQLRANREPGRRLRRPAVDPQPCDVAPLARLIRTEPGAGARSLSARVILRNANRLSEQPREPVLRPILLDRRWSRSKMAQPLAVSMLLLRPETPRDQDACQQLSDALPDASVGAPDEQAVFKSSSMRRTANTPSGAYGTRSQRRGPTITSRFSSTRRPRTLESALKRRPSA